MLDFVFDILWFSCFHVGFGVISRIESPWMLFTHLLILDANDRSGSLCSFPDAARALSIGTIRVEQYILGGVLLIEVQPPDLIITSLLKVLRFDAPLFNILFVAWLQ